MKKHMEIVLDDEVAIDAIPLVTKPPIIVGWKIIKEGNMGYFQIIRDDGSSKRYSSMIQMLQNIDREDLETLWKLVKAKHELTRPEEGYERVLWGDLKVMFEPDVESEVWRNLQGHKVTVWKLFSSSEVHFVRFQNIHSFMLVEKRYPLTPATIIEMLNKKLQADHWNEMCYQLLKLMTKQLKNPGRSTRSILKEQNEQLVKDLRTARISVVSYKTGLESVEARLVVFKKNKSVYEEDIKLLKCEIYVRYLDIIELKRKSELATKEKDKVQLTVQKFKNSSKNLSKLLDRQIMDKCKAGLGYNAIPPPYTGNFIPPKSNLFYPSLDNFVDVNKSVSEFVVEKPTKPKTARKENGAPIIED
ncbi:hypothetical protein Tco_0787708 [Tanacetum coccineum]